MSASSDHVHISVAGGGGSYQAMSPPVVVVPVQPAGVAPGVGRIVSAHAGVTAITASPLAPPLATAAPVRVVSMGSRHGAPAGNASTGVPNTAVTRQLSSTATNLLRGGIQEQFCCQICLNNYPVTNAFILTGCGHRFCGGCLVGMVESELGNGRVYLRCCFDPAAEEPAPTVASTLPEGLRTLSASFGGPAHAAAGARAAAAAAPARPDGAAAATTAASERERAAEDARPGHGTAATGTCGMRISDRDMLAIMGDRPDLLDRYRRFRAVADNPDTRTCPYTGCGGSQAGRASEPRMNCTTCGREYCFFHANAHVGKTCETYARETARENAINEAAMAKDTKECPKCHIRVSKVSGCNHMTCAKCRQDFCWLCGRAIQGGTLPTHYAWWNVCGCPNKQMSDGPDTVASRAWNFVTFVLTILVLGPLSLVFTLLTFIICAPCLIPLCIRNEGGPLMFVSAVSTMWLMVLGIIIGGLLGFPFAFAVVILACVCLPCILIAMICCRADDD